MPRKSVRPNKNFFQTAREEAGLTREKASEAIGYMSESVIEKIEYDQVMPDPQEVMDMAKAYRRPELINYYCSNMCAIGRQYMPEVKTTGLSQIVLHILASMNALEKEGIVRRVYGGAVLVGGNRDVPLQMRETEAMEAKQRIGRAAAALVQENDVIVLDASSTVYSMIPYLKEFKNVVAITSGPYMNAPVHIGAYSVLPPFS